MNPDLKSRQNYTRVTSVLYPFSGLQNIDAEIVAHAAERGTKVHQICEGIVAGLGEIGVEDETWGYVESFKKWWQSGIHVVEMEKRFWDDDLSITGQVDFITQTENGLALVDIKTSSRPSKTWPCQGSAYAYLCKKSGFDIKNIYFLHLNKHGKEPKIYEFAIDEELFKGILRTYRHFYHKD